MGVQFEVKRIFNVPKDKVYQSLLDLDSAKYWMQGFVRIERFDQGQMKVGSGWKETRKMMGHEASEVFEVTGMEPDEIHLFVDGTKGASGKGAHFYTYSLKELEIQQRLLYMVKLMGLRELQI